MAPNPASDTTETPANVAPDLARPPSNIAELNPVPKAITPSLTATTSMLAGFGYNFSSGEDRQPVDEQCENLTIGALRQLATHFHTLNPCSFLPVLRGYSPRPAMAQGQKR